MELATAVRPGLAGAGSERDCDRNHCLVERYQGERYAEHVQWLKEKAEDIATEVVAGLLLIGLIAGALGVWTSLRGAPAHVTALVAIGCVALLLLAFNQGLGLWSRVSPRERFPQEIAARQKELETALQDIRTELERVAKSKYLLHGLRISNGDEDGLVALAKTGVPWIWVSEAGAHVKTDSVDLSLVHSDKRYAELASRFYCVVEDPASRASVGGPLSPERAIRITFPDDFTTALGLPEGEYAVTWIGEPAPALQSIAGGKHQVLARTRFEVRRLDSQNTKARRQGQVV